MGVVGGGRNGRTDLLLRIHSWFKHGVGAVGGGGGVIPWICLTLLRIPHTPTTAYYANDIIIK